MKKLILLMSAIFCLGFFGSSGTALMVRAEEAKQQEAEAAELSRLMKTTKEAKAKERPDDKADAVIEYDSGAVVYVVGETADGWYKVSYQEKQGYVRKSLLTEIDEINAAELEAEMEMVETESKMVVEEVERYRAEARRSRIWGAVIILLVAGIFATGIISTVKSKKNMEKSKEEERKEQQDN